MNEYCYRITMNLVELKNPTYPKPEVDKIIQRIENDMNALKAENERLTHTVKEAEFAKWILALKNLLVTYVAYRIGGQPKDGTFEYLKKMDEKYGLTPSLDDLLTEASE